MYSFIVLHDEIRSGQSDFIGASSPVWLIFVTLAFTKILDHNASTVWLTIKQ